MFGPAVIERLQYYVYYLTDPRNNEMFYVGKGYGNRIFHHLNCALTFEERSAKLDRIRDIAANRMEVGHYVLRHGLSEAMAFEIEAALIDFVGMENLSNVMGGHYSRDYGIKSPAEIMAMYEGEPLQTDEPVLLLNVNRYYRRDISDRELYEITRTNWILGPRRNRVGFAIAAYKGLSREVYRVRKWMPVNYNGKRRWTFKGRLAPESVRRELRYKSVKQYFCRGSTNPVRYLNC